MGTGHPRLSTGYVPLERGQDLVPESLSRGSFLTRPPTIAGPLQSLRGRKRRFCNLTLSLYARG